jgi:hypothetical protein
MEGLASHGLCLFNQNVSSQSLYRRCKYEQEHTQQASSVA